MENAWLRLVQPALHRRERCPFYDVDFILNPRTWEPLLLKIRVALEAGDDLAHHRAPTTGEFSHMFPEGGTILDVMVLNANFYFETHPGCEWLEYLSVVEQLALQGVPMSPEFRINDLQIHKDVKCLHAAVVAGCIGKLRTLEDEVELNLTVQDILIREFGHFCSQKKVAFNPYSLTPEEQHFIDVSILLQVQGVTASMSANAIMEFETWYEPPHDLEDDEDVGFMAVTYLEAVWDYKEVRNILMSRLAMIFFSGAYSQLAQAKTHEGVFLLHHVGKVLASSGCLLDRCCFEFVRELGVTSRICAIEDAIIDLEKASLETRDFEDSAHVDRGLVRQQQTRIAGIIRFMRTWSTKEARFSRLIQMTLQARPVPSNVAWIIDSFLLGLAPEGSMDASFIVQTRAIEEVIDRIPLVDQDGAEDVVQMNAEELDPENSVHALPNVQIREMGEVIDQILHADQDPAAVISSKKTAQVSAELWAGSVERISTHDEANAGVADERESRLLLLTFGRHPKELEEAIEASVPAQVALKAGTDIKPAWANGAKILAEGVNHGQLEPPTVPDEGLKPYHVVLWEKDEEQLLDGLKHLPYNFRTLNPGSKGRTSVPTELPLFAMPASSDTPITLVECEPFGNAEGTDVDAGIEITIKNTFIHVTLAPVDTRSILTW